MRQFYYLSHRMFIQVSCVIFFLLCCFSLKAQHSSMDSTYTDTQLYDMSLEDLLNLKITTASKQEETVREAPGIVSIVTAKEIESYGATNLAEVLDRVAGIYMTGSYTLTNNLPVIRGESTAHWATKVLILIDGRPYRDSYLGGTLMAVMNAYPLEAVERLEIIRGPGSVLYGTNAFTGVINIILKHADKNDFRMSTRYGSFNTRQAQVYSGIKYKDLTVDASVNLYTTDGWQFTARDERAIIRSKTVPVFDSIINPARTINMDRNDVGASLRADYKGLTVNTFFGRSSWQAMNNASQWVVPANAGPNQTPTRFEVYSDKVLGDIGYKKDITSFWTSSLNLTWNRTRFDLSQADFKNRPVVTLANDLLAEWSNTIAIRSDLNGVIGFTLNNQQGSANDETKNANGTAFTQNREQYNEDPFYYVPHWNETWYSGYAQLSYTPFDYLRVVGGVQANKVTALDMHYSPRIALILKNNSGFGGKLLYGSAFRSATPGGEKAIDIPGVLRGNPDLLPEVVNTSEVQVFMAKRKFETSINYFRSEQSNEIVRTAANDPANEIANTPQYTNRGSKTSYGIEAEGKFYFSSHWNSIASFAMQRSKNDAGYKNYGGTPLYMAKLGVNYENARGLDVAVFNTFYSTGGNIHAKFSSENIPVNFAGTPTDANPVMKPVCYLTANVRLELREFWQNPDVPNVTVFCYGVNLLNQKVYYPEFSRRNINTYQGRAGFNIHAGLMLKV